MKETKTIQSYKNTAKEKKRETLKTNLSGFKDPIEIRDQNKECKPENSFNSPWDFRCPEYDQRSSNFINAGTHYGVGHNQPIGHKGNPKPIVDVLPQSRVQTMQIDDEG